MLQLVNTFQYLLQQIRLANKARNPESKANPDATFNAIA